MKGLETRELGLGSDQRRALRGLLRNANFFRCGVSREMPVSMARAGSKLDPYTGASLANNIPATIDLVVEGMLLRMYHVEGARTQLCLQSQNINAAAWGKTDVTITTGAGLAPDGTLTADLVTEGTLGTAATTAGTVTITAGQVMVISTYLKASANVTWVHMRLTSNAGANGARAWFNLVTGVLGSTQVMGTGTVIRSSITPAGGGFFRLVLVCTVDPAATTCSMTFFGASADLSTTRVNNAAYYAWGTQIEQMGAGATSGCPSVYKPTTTVTVTSASETPTVDCSALSGGGIGSLGEVFSFAIPMDWTGDQDGTTGFRILGSTDLSILRGSATTLNQRRNDVAAEGPAITHALTSRKLSTVGLAWDAVSVRGYLSGALAGTDATLSPPYNLVTSFQLGSQSAATKFFGYTGACVLHGVVATDAQRLAFEVALKRACLGFVGVL